MAWVGLLGFSYVVRCGRAKNEAFGGGQSLVASLPYLRGTYEFVVKCQVRLWLHFRHFRVLSINVTTNPMKKNVGERCEAARGFLWRGRLVHGLTIPMPRR